MWVTFCDESLANPLIGEVHFVGVGDYIEAAILNEQIGCPKFTYNIHSDEST